MNDYGRLKTTGLLALSQPKRWIWDGLVGPRNITLFTSVWKTGKTTLLAHLLAQRKQGGELAGQAVAAGVSAVVSEEGASLWNERHDRLHFRPDDSFFCRPFLTAPTQEEWTEFIEHFGVLHESEGLDLLIIDRLAYFLPPHAENNAEILREAMTPLRKLAERGVAVLLVHHPRKDPAPEGMTARGTGELQGFVDILIEMYAFQPENSADRRRRLAAFSRDPATPRALFLELQADGSRFVAFAPPLQDDLGPNWPVIRTVLEDANHELTRQEIEAQWPSTFPRPTTVTVWDLLNTLYERGLICRIGAGRRNDPFRYFLADKMAKWQQDPLFKLRPAALDGFKLPWDGQYVPPRG